jgi:hypothetical protein
MNKQQPTRTSAFLKALSVFVLNIAILAVTFLLAYEIYTNRYGVGFVSLIIALVLGVPLVLAVDMWAITGISVYTGRNIQRIRSGQPLPSPTVITQAQFQVDNGTPSHSLGTGGTHILDVPSSQSVPHKTSGTPDDFNATVAFYLSQYPAASIREVERATGIPKSSIGRTNAWQNRR